MSCHVTRKCEISLKKGVIKLKKKFFLSNAVEQAQQQSWKAGLQESLVVALLKHYHSAWLLTYGLNQMFLSRPSTKLVGLGEVVLPCRRRTTVGTIRTMFVRDVHRNNLLKV